MTENEIEEIVNNASPFAAGLGLRILSAHPDEVVAEMPAVPALGNRNGVVHGGAIMGFADNLGGMATFLNIGSGQSTTTVESKTNFLRPIRLGDVAKGICIPLHRGRTLMVWQTTVTRGDGQVAAIVIQTQMVLEWQADWGVRPGAAA